MSASAFRAMTGRQGGQAFAAQLENIPWLLRGWTPVTTVAMILGFVLYWPIGLAVIAWNWSTISWGWRGSKAERRAARYARQADTGNSAFESWKQGELDRLEAERQKLAAAQAEFSGFLDQLKHAKDREEFDRFMTARNEPKA